MPFNIGPFELLLVLVLALLVLGPGKLPEVGNALGKTIREFRKASTDVEEAVRIEPATATARPLASPSRRRLHAQPTRPRTARPAERSLSAGQLRDLPGAAVCRRGTIPTTRRS